VYGSDIASALVAFVTALNSEQLSSDTTLIQSPGLDLLNEVYADVTPAAILTRLAALGDNQTPPRRWEVGVWEGRRLHFRPLGDAARTWYVDVGELMVERSTASLVNSVRARYQDASGRTLRTAYSTDTTSVARYGITRRRSVQADTTSSTQAGAVRDAELEDRRDPRPRGQTVPVRFVEDASGSRYPSHVVRAGDVMVKRNFPPVYGATIDRVRSFRVTRTNYDLFTGLNTLEPEEPPTTLETMLTRQQIGY